VTFVRLVSETGGGVGFSPETTLFVTSTQVRDRHGQVAVPDQRLGHEMQTGVMGNIPVRVALRTLDDVDSRAVSGTDEAKYLPLKPAGAGRGGGDAHPDGLCAAAGAAARR
jgi:hypothetical protein